LYTSLTDEDKFPGARTLFDTASLKNDTGLLMTSGPWLCRWFKVKYPEFSKLTLAVAEQNGQSLLFFLWQTKYL